MYLFCLSINFKSVCPYTLDYFYNSCYCVGKVISALATVDCLSPSKLRFPWFFPHTVVFYFSFSRQLTRKSEHYLACRSSSSNIPSAPSVFSWDVLGLFLTHMDRGVTRDLDRVHTQNSGLSFPGSLLKFSWLWMPSLCPLFDQAKKILQVLWVFSPTFSFHMASVIFIQDKALKSREITLCQFLVGNFNSPPKSVCFYLLSRIIR